MTDEPNFWVHLGRAMVEELAKDGLAPALLIGCNHPGEPEAKVGMVALTTLSKRSLLRLLAEAMVMVGNQPSSNYAERTTPP